MGLGAKSSSNMDYGVFCNQFFMDSLMQVQMNQHLIQKLIFWGHYFISSRNWMCLMISLSLREASLDKNFAAAFAMMYPLHACTHPKTKNAWDLHTFPHHSFFGLDLSVSPLLLLLETLHSQRTFISWGVLLLAAPPTLKNFMRRGFIHHQCWGRSDYFGLHFGLRAGCCCKNWVSLGSNHSVCINCTYCMFRAVCNTIPCMACGW